VVGTPVLTAHKVKDALDVSFPSASAALKKMEEMGILTRPNRYRRNRIFVATEVIDILNRPAGR
jgi:DNA-binding transcriptional regulator GbsR (MarR family)